MEKTWRAMYLAKRPIPAAGTVTAEVMRESVEHSKRLRKGCTRCHSAVPGRICPDCFICCACKPGAHDHG